MIDYDLMLRVFMTSLLIFCVSSAIVDFRYKYGYAGTRELCVTMTFVAADLFVVLVSALILIWF